MTEQQADEKQCPFCAETIKAAAIVCKHCGRDLPATRSAATAEMLALCITEEQGRFKWRGNYFRDLESAVRYAKQNPDTAAYAPSSAPPTKPFKWWLWVPLGLVALFFIYAASIPKYESNARAMRRVCEEQFMKLGMANTYECDRAYEEALRKGREEAKQDEDRPLWRSR